MSLDTWHRDSEKNVDQEASSPNFVSVEQFKLQRENFLSYSTRLHFSDFSLMVLVLPFPPRYPFLYFEVITNVLVFGSSESVICRFLSFCNFYHPVTHMT